MTNAFTFHGQEGELLWGYLPAASLGPWTFTADHAGGDLTAQVKDADTFRTSQPFLTFRVVRQNASVWIWPVQSLHIADGRLTARLGPQE